MPALRYSYSAAMLGILLLFGCSTTPPPDTYLTTMPTGLWVSVENSETTIDIQDGGFIKLVRNASEATGSWTLEGASTIRAEFSGQSYDMPFTRKDLDLEITLPGDTLPTKFSQM